MKVSTDACIQGAWTPIPSAARRACDVGTGTGLLALMLAQRKPDLGIEALELLPEAANQARANIASSSFASRINVSLADVRCYVPAALYDFIICNPPFFENSLQSDNNARMQARHTDTLSYEVLADFISTNLTPEGVASVLLPASQEVPWLKAAGRSSLHLSGQLRVRPTERKDYNRVVFIMGKQPTKTAWTEYLTIYQSQGVYTSAFIDLLSPFYLQL